MTNFSELSLVPALLLFLSAAGVIAIAGTAITRTADALADATRWGEALFGGLLLGASTSVPGIMTSVTAASAGHADLAFSNAVGGIAAQTVFLVIADMCYRPANLEHAAASVPNMMQGTVLIILLGVVLLLMNAPEVTILAIHPGSAGLLILYIYGVRIVGGARGVPGWSPLHTPETVVDEPHRAAPATARQLFQLWLRFGIAAAILMVAGYVVAKTGVAISRQTGLSETIVGVLFTAVATSLPELVTSVAAVRQGALTLAVGNIIGGNSFDVLFVSFADAAYRPGSIYHAVGTDQAFVVALAVILSGILLMGLLRREKSGIANIGFESFAVVIAYLAGMTTLFLWN